MLGLMPELIESNGFSVHGVNPPFSGSPDCHNARSSQRYFCSAVSLIVSGTITRRE